MLFNAKRFFGPRGCLPLFFPLFLFPSLVDNGRKHLAELYFDCAKKAYARQDFPRAIRDVYLCIENAPSSGAPWFLAGAAFYLAGEDEKALFHYRQGMRRNPDIKKLPPFPERLAQPKNRPVIAPEKEKRLRQALGQHFLISISGTTLSAAKRRMLEKGEIGGVVLFGPNIRSRDQVRELIRDIQSASPFPVWIAVDQEGGFVQRLRAEHGFRNLPPAAALGEKNDPRAAYLYGKTLGRELSQIGVNLNLAPVVDVDRGDPASVITRYKRALGSDPEKIARLASFLIQGMQEEGVLACAKHFPGQTITTLDPHVHLARSKVPWEDIWRFDIAVYRSLIKNGLKAVMTAHLIHPEVDRYLPVSLSPVFLKTILRERLGFQGLILTDDLCMRALRDHFPPEESAKQAISAGADLIIVTDNSENRLLDALVQSVVKGELSEEEVLRRQARLLAFKSSWPNKTVRLGTTQLSKKPENP